MDEITSTAREIGLSKQANVVRASGDMGPGASDCCSIGAKCFYLDPQGSYLNDGLSEANSLATLIAQIVSSRVL